jgi:choline-sulfatase
MRRARQVIVLTAIIACVITAIVSVPHHVERTAVPMRRTSLETIDLTGTNVVVVTLDTTRADHIGAYGDPRAAGAPALDRLAREGVLFEDANSPVPLTLPAYCTLFTDRLPPKHGLHDNVGILDGSIPPLASALRANGYRTAAFVGSRILAATHGLNHGFDRYDDDIPWGASGPGPRRAARAVVDGALDWIGSIKGSPFFIWIHLYDGHAPYQASPPFDRTYRNRPYEAAIASIDAQIDRLRTFLDQNGLTDRTVITIVGDHGEGLGDHGEQTHGLFVYQSVLRVPFIIRAPGIVPRGRVKTPVSSADLMPTVLDLLGTDRVENGRWPESRTGSGPRRCPGNRRCLC